MPSKKPKPVVRPHHTTIENCNFTVKADRDPVDAKTLLTIAEVTREGFITLQKLTDALKAQPHFGPMVHIGPKANDEP